MIITNNVEDGTFLCSVTLECSPAEWLIIHKALSLYTKNAADVALINKMINTEPRIKEVET